MFYIDKNLNYGRKVIKDFIAKLPNIDKCLDLGAGQGEDLITLQKKHPQAQLNAIECHQQSMAALQSKNITVYPQDLEKQKLPFADNSLDLIIANQTLEHTKEIFWILHEVTRIVKVGGHLVIGIPNLASLHNRILLLLGKQPTVIQNHSAHIRGFTKPDLIKLLNIFPEGYQLVAFRGSNFYPFSPFIAQPLAHFLPTMAWGIFFLFKKVTPYQGQYIEHPIRESLQTNFYLG